MCVLYRLTPKLRRELKKPIGTLLRGSFDETMKKLIDLVQEREPPMVISVGDRVSQNLAESKISQKLSIVDNKIMRRRIKPIPLIAEDVLYVHNPSGTITEEALEAIRKALRSNRRAKIVVDGEEDLLALIAVMYAPENSLVVYGQPREGIVVIKVTSQKRTEIAEILEAMENIRKAK